MKWFQTGVAATAPCLAMYRPGGAVNAFPESFTVVNAPCGGQYIYGPLTGEGSSMSEAVPYECDLWHPTGGNTATATVVPSWDLIGGKDY